MTATLNGEARTAAKTAADHIAEGEYWLDRAHARFADAGGAPTVEVATMQKFAELHFLAATAVDIDREADAEQRIASCVPDGSESLSVSVRGR